MLIILIGSIGGRMLAGITGLFIGAVIHALGYQLFQMWVEIDPPEVPRNIGKTSKRG